MSLREFHFFHRRASEGGKVFMALSVSVVLQYPSVKIVIASFLFSLAYSSHILHYSHPYVHTFSYRDYMHGARKLPSRETRWALKDIFGSRLQTHP